MPAGDLFNSTILASFQDGKKTRQLRSLLKGLGVRISVPSNLHEAYKNLSDQKPDVVIVEPVLSGEGAEMLLANFLNHCRTDGIAVILVVDDPHLSLPSCCQELPRANFPFIAEDVTFKISAEHQIAQLNKELAQARSLLERREEELAGSLESAAYIQRSLIPHQAPEIQEFSFAWQFLPSEHGLVGGDLFNVVRLDENYLGVYILDVSGHGFPAAMVTVSLSQALDQHLSQVVKKRVSYPPFYQITPPAEVLAYLNHEYPVERFEKFFTICYAVLDMRTGKVRFSNAGHPLPVVIRRDGKVIPLEERGTIVGLINAPFPEAEVILAKGDRLYFYTDGITEHQNGEGTFFGEARLYETLSRCVGEPLENACKSVISSLSSFSGKSKVSDDVTLLGVEYTGPPGP